MTIILAADMSFLNQCYAFATTKEPKSKAFAVNSQNKWVIGIQVTFISKKKASKNAFSATYACILIHC